MAMLNNQRVLSNNIKCQMYPNASFSSNQHLAKPINKGTTDHGSFNFKNNKTISSRQFTAMSLRLYSRTGNRRCSTLFRKFPLISFLSHVATRWLMSVVQFLQICTDLTYTHLHRFSHRKWPHLCRFPTLGVSGSSKSLNINHLNMIQPMVTWESPLWNPHLAELSPNLQHTSSSTPQTPCRTKLQKRRPSRNATDAWVAPRAIKQGMLVTVGWRRYGGFHSHGGSPHSWWVFMKILPKCHGWLGVHLWKPPCDVFKKGLTCGYQAT